MYVERSHYPSPVILSGPEQFDATNYPDVERDAEREVLARMINELEWRVRVMQCTPYQGGF